MTHVLLLTGLAPHLPQPLQRTISVRAKCLPMSTPKPPFFLVTRAGVVPTTPSPVIPTGGRRVSVARGEGTLATTPPNLQTMERSPSTHLARFNVRTGVPFTFCSSTPKATVLLVFPTKSLRMRVPGSRVSATSFNQFSLNARRPRLAFSKVSRRKRLFRKASRKSFSSSRWRSL